jgi:hypothetical protein
VTDARVLRAAVGRARQALRSAQQTLARLDTERLDADDWQDANARIGQLMNEFRGAVGEANRLLGLGGGRDRLLRYLRRHVGRAVTGAQLSGVAGIYEWARRVRELRVEEGWPIEAGALRPDLEAQEYMLTADEPDAELAAQWQLAKRVRNIRNVSGKARVLTYLQELSPRPADQDQLGYVANIKSWQRRMRELDEEGWEIRSNIDEPDLRPGGYRLASLTMRPARQRKAIKLRWQILERDEFKCHDCSRQRGDPGVRLQVHHIQEVRRLGSNDPNNLVTLCSDCHAGRHAVSTGKTVDELLNPPVAT